MAEAQGFHHVLPGTFMIGQGFATAGPRGARRAEAEYLVARSASTPVSPLELASAYAQADDPDAAFEWLEKAYEQREPMLVHVRAAPNFDSLREDPRFAALLRRIGFPE